ncbi:MAG: hypothetical protein PHP73_01180 [Candidatus Omnitrophica bacterium]|nr:hypothetical protein [Candidatus Omnitrophota bacterium]
MDKLINLADFLIGNETTLVGRDNGENVFDKLVKAGLSFVDLESKFDKIIIGIPDRVVSINKSFFLGLFETVIERLKKGGFYAKYDFETSEHIKNKIESHVDAALLNASQKDILNA